MTNKEAATIVERIRYYMESGECWAPTEFEAMDMAIEALTAQPNDDDTISRHAAIKAIENLQDCYNGFSDTYDKACIIGALEEVPSAQLGQRYTNEELMIFQHGISLSLLSKRSAQHWRYDENTATEIKFLERLYEKVSANMRGEQDG